MVLELLISPRKAERRPWELFVIGLVYASVAIFLSMWIFQDYVGLVMVFLTVLASIYLIHGTLSYEEKKDLAGKKEILLLKEHSKALLFFMFLFLGFVVAFSLWYILLPQDTVTNVFGVQISTITAVNANATSFDFFGKIFFNNMKVLFFCILFAFFYGAGAIFVLAWNASVVGAAVGSVVRNSLALIANEAGFVNLGAYFSAYSFGLLKYLTHGVFEILAYFTAALGAGIIAIAVARHDFGSREFKHIVADSFDLIALSVVILLIAAFIETFVTPALF
jgi:stage II sporulation protein M